MSAKKSGKYSPMFSESGGVPEDGVMAAKVNISIKTVVIFLAAAAVFIAILATAAFALGIASLGNKPKSSVPSPSPSVAPSKQPAAAPKFVTNSNCGDGQWKRVAFLNMSDPTQECPRGWRGYPSPVRCCGRPVSDRSSCPAVFFPSYGYQYSKVCGRAIGYQQGSPDGFASIVHAEPDTDTVNGIYVDGVSVTYGNPRTHIWTFAVGVHEHGDGNVNNNNNCPCDGGTSPPSFVGNNYFCETGDDTPNVQLHRFYDEDPLWDGFNCNNPSCCQPPWFKVVLTSPTMDDIEVRICGDQRTGDEDSPLSLLELYVQ